MYKSSSLVTDDLQQQWNHSFQFPPFEIQGRIVQRVEHSQNKIWHILCDSVGSLSKESNDKERDFLGTHEYIYFFYINQTKQSLPE